MASVTREFKFKQSCVTGGFHTGHHSSRLTVFLYLSELVICLIWVFTSSPFPFTCWEVTANHEEPERGCLLGTSILRGWPIWERERQRQREKERETVFNIHWKPPQKCPVVEVSLGALPRRRSLGCPCASVCVYTSLSSHILHCFKSTSYCIYWGWAASENDKPPWE